jgi:hypothetical protein
VHNGIADSVAVAISSMRIAASAAQDGNQYHRIMADISGVNNNKLICSEENNLTWLINQRGENIKSRK